MTKLFGYDDSWGRLLEFETGLNEPTLRHMIDKIFPMPQESNMKFSDCFFGENSDSFFDSEELYY